jgi:hypothetical protein
MISLLEMVGRAVSLGLGMNQPRELAFLHRAGGSATPLLSSVIFYPRVRTSDPTDSRFPLQRY